jgi:glycosyltransferase involved in cell wall biosynthesis
MSTVPEGGARDGRGRLFGVLVTYQRPDDLRHYLALLAADGGDLAGIVVVDNDPGAVGEAIVAAAAATLKVTYVASPENLGPAGGLRLGLAHVEQEAGPDDWVALLDDDNPPRDPAWIAGMHRFAAEQRADDRRVGMVGLGGGRYDRANGRIVRLPERELEGPVDADFVPGNALPVLSIAALRHAGPPDETLFFGMEEVEFGLRLKRHGYRVVIDGPLLRRRREQHGRTGDDVGPAVRKTTLWRRYYAVRNQIVLARRYGRPGAGVRATVENLVGRPFADLRHGRTGGLRLGWLGLRGAADAWTGRLGRRVDPADPRYRAPTGIEHPERTVLAEPSERPEVRVAAPPSPGGG